MRSTGPGYAKPRPSCACGDDLCRDINGAQTVAENKSAARGADETAKASKCPKCGLPMISVDGARYTPLCHCHADAVAREMGARRFGEQLKASVLDRLKGDVCGQPIPAAAHNGVEGELASEGERPALRFGAEIVPAHWPSGGGYVYIRVGAHQLFGTLDEWGHLHWGRHESGGGAYLKGDALAALNAAPPPPGYTDKAVIPQSTKANLPAEVARLRVDFAMKLQDACRLLARRENITAVIPGDGSPPYCRWTTDHDDTFQVSEIGITIWRSPQGQMRPYDPIHFDWS